MENKQPVLDAIVLQQYGAFKGWIHEQNVYNIVACGGLTQFPDVHLLDTDDRPVDNGVKDGTNPIYDILVHELEKNKPIYLN